MPISLKDKSKIDNKTMKLLKLSEIRHIIAHTTLGDLCLMLKLDGTSRDYRFVLDAVPVDDEKNKELLALFNGNLFEI